MQVRFLLCAVLAAGCSFPEVNFGGGPASGGGGNGASPPDGGNGVGGNGGGSPPIGGAPACDVDQDGALIEATGCCTEPAECDCDDDDVLVFPGQTMFFEQKRKNIANESSPLAFDYNCNGMGDPEFPNGTCDTLNQCVLPPIPEVFDPADQFACGAIGNHRFCATTCDSDDPSTLRCR